MTRQMHHLERDHFGIQKADSIVLARSIGRYVMGTPVQDMLADLVARQDLIAMLRALPTTVFTLDAFLGRNFTLDAVLQANVMAAGFTLDAQLQRGGSFTLDASLKGIMQFGFTLDAFLA